MSKISMISCSKHIPNRFELVVLAAHRAQAISAGSTVLTSNKKKSKDAVSALQEISEGHIDIENLRKVVTERYISTDDQNETDKNIFKSDDFSIPDIEESNNPEIDTGFFGDDNLNIED